MGLKAPYLNFCLHLVFLLSRGVMSTETLRTVGDWEPWMATSTYRERYTYILAESVTDLQNYCYSLASHVPLQQRNSWNISYFP